MKKLFSMFFMATMLCMVMVACGDDNDEPTVPTTNKIESVYTNETDLHYTFDINLDKDSSSIYIYNVKFRIGDSMSPAMTLRVDAPVTVDKSGKVYTYAGTGIVAYMLRNTTWQPMQDESYLVNDLICTVNTDAKTFFISFNCHGGHFEQNGQLK